MGNERPRRKEVVAGDERRKANFLTEYAEVCERHGMIVTVLPVDGDTFYHPFVVAELPAVGDDSDTPALKKVIQELLMGDLWLIEVTDPEQEA